MPTGSSHSCVSLLISYFAPTQSLKTGLFSAVVASLIQVSIQDIKQDPQDTTNFYLANIYATLADPSQSNSTSLPTSPPPFSPPTFAVWVNGLWFLSLVISLTCALLATLRQQWARRYLKLTQSRYSPHKRARIRAFFFKGVGRFFPFTFDALAALLHISLFLFFAGLLVYLSQVHFTIFRLVNSWVFTYAAQYVIDTLTPLIQGDISYHTPFSLSAWHIGTGILFFIFRVLQWLADSGCFGRQSRGRFHDLAESYGKLLVQGMQKMTEETALKLPSEIDPRAFMWTFNRLEEDQELERFFFGIPGFRGSKVIEDPLPSLTGEETWRLHRAMAGLLDRTFSSDLLPARDKERRAILCAKAADLPQISGAFSILPITLSENTNQDRDPLAAKILEIVRDLGNSEDEGATLRAQADISSTIARDRTRNDCWFILASKSLGVPEGVLRGYAANGDNLSLAILIHVTRQQFSHSGKLSWPYLEFRSVLNAASVFNVQDTSPELQHKFCVLWNQIVRKAQNGYSKLMALYILRPIRQAYITLHQDTDSIPTQFSASTEDWAVILRNPSSYPVCNVPGHHSNSTPHIPASPTFECTVPRAYDNTVPIPSLLAGGPDTSPLLAHAPLRVDESFADAPVLDNIVFNSVSLQHVDEIIPESCRAPATSPNPVATHATLGSIDTPARAMLSTPGPSASAPPSKSRASTSPLDASAFEHALVGRTPSLDVPSSPSPTQVRDDMLHTGPPLSSDSAMT